MYLLNLREKLDEGMLVADRGIASPYYLMPPASIPHVVGDVVEAVS